MVPIRNVAIDLVEFPDARIDRLGPDPTVVVSDVVGEREFGSRQHADRDIEIALGRKAARRGAAECRGYQGFSNFRRACRDGV